MFRALYLGGWDIVKTHYELQQASVTARLLAAQVGCGESSSSSSVC